MTQIDFREDGSMDLVDVDAVIGLERRGIEIIDAELVAAPASCAGVAPYDIRLTTYAAGRDPAERHATLTVCPIMGHWRGSGDRSREVIQMALLHFNGGVLDYYPEA